MIDSPNEPTDLQKQQENDEDFRQLLSLKLVYQVRPPADIVIHCTPAVKTYLAMWENIEVKNGILFRRKLNDDGNASKSVSQFLLPHSQRAGFLQQVHAGFGGGHLGIRRTLDAVKIRANWVGWAAGTDGFVSHARNAHATTDDRPQARSIATHDYGRTLGAARY